MVVVTTGATSVGAHERPCQLQWQNGQQAALTDLCGGGTDVHGERHHNHSCALPMGALSAERTCQDWQEKKKGKQEIASGSLAGSSQRNASDATQRRHRLRSIARSNASASCTLRH